MKKVNKILTLIIVSLVFFSCNNTSIRNNSIQHMVNDEDSLIADETWVCLDTIGLGFTFNSEIAYLLDAQKDCQVVYRDSLNDTITSYWFTYQNHIPHLCFDPTHRKCDGECECDGVGCTIVQKLIAYETYRFIGTKEGYTLNTDVVSFIDKTEGIDIVNIDTVSKTGFVYYEFKYNKLPDLSGFQWSDY